MYSLYRAWLMRDTVTAASWTTPPDLIITVGNLGSEFREESLGYGYQFVAHKQLVSMHSGYLKSLIQNGPSSTGISITNINLPNISSESFATLLSFMYTGYLDLTNDNIYSVLLATHLLHMPRALDLCRAYLVQNQPNFHQSVSDPFQPQTNPNLVKPIPSRKVQNFGTSIWSPVNVPPLLLQTRPDGPFQCVSPSEKLATLQNHLKQVESRSPLAVPSTSKSSESSATSPSFSNSSFTCNDRTVDIVRSANKKAHRKRESSVKVLKKINNENLKVEFDVACCDGPVRFHRVLNESYGTTLNEMGSEDATPGKIDQDDLDKMTEKEYLENYPKSQFLKLKSSNFSNFMHQQMLNSNSFRKTPKTTRGVIQMRKIVKKEITTESEQQESENSKEVNGREDSSDKSFTCIYCKHTFKSQYCYQKHARRHINSVQEEARSEAKNEKLIEVRPELTTTNIPKDGHRETGTVRREVRLLDMNVQYYPCKTCGSKFPSYYFVHKHRKLCHANEENCDENSNNPLESTDSSSSDSVLPQQKTTTDC